MKKHLGFTLIELMVATVVFAIIVSAAVPTFRSFLERKSLPEVAKMLEKSILAARVQARSKSTTATLEPIGTSWNDGWRVFWIDDTDTKQTLREYPAVPPTTTVTSLEYSSSAPLLFTAEGQADRIGTFSLNQASANAASTCQYTLNVLVSGMVQKRYSGC